MKHRTPSGEIGGRDFRLKETLNKSELSFQENLYFNSKQGYDPALCCKYMNRNEHGRLRNPFVYFHGLLDRFFFACHGNHKGKTNKGDKRRHGKKTQFHFKPLNKRAMLRAVFCLYFECIRQSEYCLFGIFGESTSARYPNKVIPFWDSPLQKDSGLAP